MGLVAPSGMPRRRLISRLANTWTYTYYYDRAGNPDSVIKTRAGLTDRFQYGWDALNRLVSVRHNGTLIARYAYDVLNRRIAKRVYSAITGGTVGYLRFVYHGDHVAFERDSANTLGKRYVWGMGTDDLIGYWLPPNKMYYVVKDKLGSIRSVVIRAGTWQYSERFGPYGESIEFNGTDLGLRYRWTGREYDAETGWYFHRARYYEPAARRFVQEDPAGYAGSANLYSYVDGDVVEHRDPSGLLKDNALFGKAGPDNWWEPGVWQTFISDGAYGLLASSRSAFHAFASESDEAFERMLATTHFLITVTAYDANGNSSTRTYEWECSNCSQLNLSTGEAALDNLSTRVMLEFVTSGSVLKPGKSQWEGLQLTNEMGGWCTKPRAHGVLATQSQ